MRTFSCQSCGTRTFFDNVVCERCGTALGYVWQTGELHALQPATEGVDWVLTGAPESDGYHSCANAPQAQCNWLIPARDVARNDGLCLACGLNEVIPDLHDPANRDRWVRLEAAKRRVVHTLLALGLPVEAKTQTPDGLAFRFVEKTSAEPAMTGHDDGTITVDIAEADDATREARRVRLGEPYRTLVGHLRHESGHYYWERLVDSDQARLAEYRALFGDERYDYGEAIDRHYEQGPPADWPETFISSYATMHPWEDWAETWAHYLHMADTTDTACFAGLAPPGRSESGVPGRQRFDADLRVWMDLTVTLNELARSMGAPDLYPFVLTRPIQDKLFFVHRIVHSRSLTAQT